MLIVPAEPAGGKNQLDAALARPDARSRANRLVLRPRRRFAQRPPSGAPQPSAPPAPQSYYDTNVFTTDPAQGAFIPGDYIPGTGVATFSGFVVDPAWGALPPTGPLNGIGLEIARITFLSVDAGAGYCLRDIVGELRASDASDTPIVRPPMPTPARFIPESNVVFGGVALTLFSARRRKRRGRCR